MAEKLRKDLGFKPLYASLSLQETDLVAGYNPSTQQLFYREFPTPENFRTKNQGFIFTYKSNDTSKPNITGEFNEGTLNGVGQISFTTESLDGVDLRPSASGDGFFTVGSLLTFISTGSGAYRIVKLDTLSGSYNASNTSFFSASYTTASVISSGSFQNNDQIFVYLGGSGGGGGSTPSLQEVTNVGNTTTTPITASTLQITKTGSNTDLSLRLDDPNLSPLGGVGENSGFYMQSTYIPGSGYAYTPVLASQGIDVMKFGTEVTLGRTLRISESSDNNNEIAFGLASDVRITGNSVDDTLTLKAEDTLITGHLSMSNPSRDIYVRSGNVFVGDGSTNFPDDGSNGNVYAAGTGSFTHVSSSGGLFANLVDNSGGTLKTVIFDNTTGQLFTTTSTAAGVPSLEAVSEVDPFRFASGKIMTASNGANSGIYVNNIYNGGNAGRMEFNYASNGGGVLTITDGGTADTTTFYEGLYLSGGLDSSDVAPAITAKNGQGLDIIHGSVSDATNYHKIANFSFNNSSESEPSNYNLILYSGSIGNTSTFGNLRVNRTRAENIDVRQILVRPVSTTTKASTVLYDTPIKTRISQKGGTAADQFLEFSGSGFIMEPTSSMPTAIAGAMIYSGSQFYIAVP